MIVNEEQIQLRVENITFVSKINPTLLDKFLISLIKEAMGKPTYADSYKPLWVHTESNIQHLNRKQKT